MVRGLSDAVLQRLRLRAARAGRSAEAEAREIITAAVTEKRGTVGARELQSFVDKLYGAKRPLGVVGDLIAERRAEEGQEAQ